MILSTSVTNPSKKRFRKTALIYALLTIFFFAFSRIYESFSFGETSSHMHYLFVIPLAGGILLLLFMKIIPNLSRPQPLELSCSHYDNRHALPWHRQPIWSLNDAGYALLVPRSSLCGSGTTLHGLYSQCMDKRDLNTNKNIYKKLVPEIILKLVFSA